MGKLLIAIVIPGLLLAFLYALYIFITVIRDPTLAPPYVAEQLSLREKMATMHDILPVGIHYLSRDWRHLPRCGHAFRGLRFGGPGGHPAGRLLR